MTDYKLTQKSIVDELAQFIRQVDGNHKMGAGSLAEKICERFRVDAPAVQGEPVGYVRPHQLEALRSGKACGITLEDKPDAHNRVTIPLYATAPDVEGLVEALEAALMVMTSKEVRLEKQADAITMARAALAAHRKQGGVS